MNACVWGGVCVYEYNTCIIKSKNFKRTHHRKGNKSRKVYKQGFEFLNYQKESSPRMNFNPLKTTDTLRNPKRKLKHEDNTEHEKEYDNMGVSI